MKTSRWPSVILMNHRILRHPLAERFQAVAVVLLSALRVAHLAHLRVAQAARPCKSRGALASVRFRVESQPVAWRRADFFIRLCAWREDLNIEQRVAIITGASRGIGRATATRLAADGRLVVLVSRTSEALEEVKQAIQSQGGKAVVRACDVTDAAAITSMIDEVASTHGRLDILVNNAGMTRDGLLLRMSDADFDDVINVNLRSAFVACRAAARPMMRGRFGRIVNIGSVTGVMGNSGQANYAAAKAGLAGLTKSIAKELGSKGITANVIAPGFVETVMTSGLPQQLKDEAEKHIPVRRFGTVDEIAHSIAFVTSDLASYITGQVIVVDGGLAM